MFFWHVPKPNEALLISGSKHRDPAGPQFRIVTGHGCFVLPIKQRANHLSLALQEAEIVEEVVSQQGIRLQMRAVAVFKVGDDPQSIANAARRFLSEQARMEELVGRVFAGHLRSIVGGLTVEQIIRERDRVAQEIKDGSHPEMEKLGLVVDSLQIQEVEDVSGYITNLAAPHAAAVASQARIAQAAADQAAAQREQEAARNKAEFERQTKIAQAGYKAEVDRAQAEAAQAGPLSQARASQEVISEQTALAQRQADLAAQRLVADVEKPADAEAYRIRTLAQAERDSMMLRAEALKGGNQELLASRQLVDQLPQLVDSSAEALQGSNVVVLNGASGVNDVLSGVAAQGMAILEVLRKGLSLSGQDVTADPRANGDRPDAGRAKPAPPADARDTEAGTAG